jgi:hypothetical protein
LEAFKGVPVLISLQRQSVKEYHTRVSRPGKTEVTWQPKLSMKFSKAGVVTHTCNPSTGEAEVGDQEL